MILTRVFEQTDVSDVRSVSWVWYLGLLLCCSSIHTLMGQWLHSFCFKIVCKRGGKEGGATAWPFLSSSHMPMHPFHYPLTFSKGARFHRSLVPLFGVLYGTYISLKRHLIPYGFHSSTFTVRVFTCEPYSTLVHFHTDHPMALLQK